MARAHGLHSHSPACSSFGILELVLSHFLPFMFNSCFVKSFSYFADSVVFV